jgi:DNA-damage-inducible protein D
LERFKERLDTPGDKAMKKDLVEITHHQTFESLKQEEEGCEFWGARKLTKVLEYSEYRHFLPVVEKAKDACKNSGHNTSDHFEDILDMIEIGKGGQRQVEDIKNAFREH